MRESLTSWNNFKGYLLISGILNQQKLYKHMGFIPFGPIVGNDFASFQPMYMLKEECKLDEILNGKYVQLFMGSGTLANDVIAAQLSLIKSKGLILSNGEFGDRLINHGKKFKLDFETYIIEYGKSFVLDEIENILKKNKDIKWIFMTHCETSTGILNDIKQINFICKNRSVLLCLDTISSVGNVDVDLKW